MLATARCVSLTSSGDSIGCGGMGVEGLLIGGGRSRSPLSARLLDAASLRGVLFAAEVAGRFFLDVDIEAGDLASFAKVGVCPVATVAMATP